MGQTFEKISTPVYNFRNAISRKRPRTADDDTDKSFNSPKRRKVLSTASYVYQTLFKESKGSDVVVLALEKSWHLHKIYLCQSPYFNTMFNGSWKETNQDVIPIEICDEHITIDSLNKVFGSLYLGEITVEPSDIISILATASLFQLDCIIDQCTQVMNETMNTKNVVTYYEQANRYGVKSVKENAYQWLLINMLTFTSDQVEVLRDISVELMSQLVSSSDLFVVQTEFSIYSLLRLWLYARLNPEWQTQKLDDNTEMLNQLLAFFQNREGQMPFLLTERGSEFTEPFRELRLEYILLNRVDIEIMRLDNILPSEWIDDRIIMCWSKMLRVDQGLDTGPKTIIEPHFYNNCCRFGRVLTSAGNHMWRWIGFNYGLDLIVIIEDGVCLIKRNQRNVDGPLLGTKTTRDIIYRMTLVSLTEQKQPKYTQKTEPKIVTLPRNVEVVLFPLDKELTYPIILSLNVLVTSSSVTNSNDSLTCASGST